MYKILFDADLILDAVMNRTKSAKDVKALLDSSYQSMRLYLTDVGLQKISAYTYCIKNCHISEVVVGWLQEQMQICTIDQTLLEDARYLSLDDFESAVELACLRNYQLDAIVTNKPENFMAISHQSYIWSFADLWLRIDLESQLQTTTFS
jgi:hypothetical protein